MAGLILGLGHLSAENTYLLSYPRSGSAWVMYTVQYVTQQRWHDGSAILVFPPLKKEIRKGRPILFRSHLARSGRIFSSDKNRPYRCSPKNDKLIILVRNYKECLMRHLGYDIDRILQNIETPMSVCYFQVLKCYDQWNPAKRLLVYYEELMLRPEQELRRINDFLGASEERFAKFMDNYQQHVDQSFKIKAERKAPTPSQGKDLLYHTQKLNNKYALRQIDQLVKSKYPDLYEKYLTRYN